jgi:threonine synthase
MVAARAGLPCFIFVPASAPRAKLAQIRAHGARLFAVRGSYDEAFDLCAEVCRRFHLYNRNTATNPVLGEGKKTLALEIWEQLGSRAPDAVLAPVGDGCILGGAHKGFRDLRELGLIPGLPRLIGVQAEGSAALASAWSSGRSHCLPVTPSTLADSLAVSIPRDQVKALRAVRETRGGFVTVSDEEILQAMRWLSSRAGILAEPAAAASLAGLVRGLQTSALDPEEEVVLLLTGHGLKDIDSVARSADWNEPVAIGPSLQEVERVLGAIGFPTSPRIPR